MGSHCSRLHTVGSRVGAHQARSSSNRGLQTNASIGRRSGSLKLTGERGRLKKQCSGLEGRHGFVVTPRLSSETSQISRRSSNLAPADRGSARQHRRPSSGEGSHHLDKKSSSFGEALHQLWSKAVGGDAEGEEPVEIDVVFLFKKALEFKRGRPMTVESLPDAIQGVITDLDPQATGHIARVALVDYIQSTCVAANMVQPSQKQVLNALRSLHLDSHEAVTTNAAKAALLDLEWHIVPLHPRPSLFAGGLMPLMPVPPHTHASGSGIQCVQPPNQPAHVHSLSRAGSGAAAAAAASGGQHHTYTPLAPPPSLICAMSANLSSSRNLGQQVPPRSSNGAFSSAARPSASCLDGRHSKVHPSNEWRAQGGAGSGALPPAPGTQVPAALPAATPAAAAGSQTGVGVGVGLGAVRPTVAEGAWTASAASAQQQPTSTAPLEGACVGPSTPRRT